MQDWSAVVILDHVLAAAECKQTPRQHIQNLCAAQQVLHKLLETSECEEELFQVTENQDWDIFW